MANTTNKDTYALSQWPTKIVWTTYIGSTLYTGKALAATPENNPVRVVYGSSAMTNTTPCAMAARAGI